VITEAQENVTKKKPEPSAEQKAAEELLRQAPEQGLSLTGPDALLKQPDQFDKRIFGDRHAGVPIAGAAIRRGPRVTAGEPRVQGCQRKVAALREGAAAANVARTAGRSGPHDGHPWSSGCSACSHRGWPAEPVAHPAARRGERDPERIAHDHEKQGGWRWQAHRHGASRPVTVTDNGRRPGSGAQAPHHVPVRWLPGHQDHRGQNDCQRPHGKGDSHLSDRPCVLDPASIRPRWLLRWGWRRVRPPGR
jgi:hypothetical protein